MADARKYWLLFCNSLCLNRNVADNLFEKLAVRYASPPRYYHTLEGHIAECIGELALIKELPLNLIEVKAAIWTHDACYDTHSYTNEEESVNWAIEFYKQANIAMDFDKLRDFILLTKHHQSNNSLDAQIVSDCDLAILGKSEIAFDEYERNIRREYDWVPEDIFREHRAGFLEEFLKRPQIYYTERFKEKYENHARLNLARSIRMLKSAKPLL